MKLTTLCLLLLLANTAHAGLVKVPQHGFSVQVPGKWTLEVPQMGRGALRATSPDGGQVFIAFAEPNNAPDSSLKDIAAQFRQNLVDKQQAKLGPERQINLNGVSFNIINAIAGETNFDSYLALANGRFYLLQIYSLNPETNASDNPDLFAIMQSFRLMKEE